MLTSPESIAGWRRGSGLIIVEVRRGALGRLAVVTSRDSGCLTGIVASGSLMATGAAGWGKKERAMGWIYRT